MTGRAEDEGARRGGRDISVHAVVKVCATVLGFVTLIYVLLSTPIALGIALAALLLAVALDHPAMWLCRHGWPRWLSIAVVTLSFLLALGGAAMVLIPPAAEQAAALATNLPSGIKRLQGSDWYARARVRFDLDARVQELEARAPEALARVVNEALQLAGGVLLVIAAVVSIFFLALFMLAYGRESLSALFALAPRRHHGRLRRVLGELYQRLGGYIGGLAVICVANASATAVFLAILGVPYFLPLAIFSGLSSFVPAIGATLAGIVLSLVALASAGLWKAVAVAIYYFIYQQVENQVFGPLIYERTVKVNPLASLLAVLFFGELFGIAGALVAVPGLAAGQVILHAVLRSQRRSRRMARRSVLPEPPQPPQPPLPQSH